MTLVLWLFGFRVLPACLFFTRPSNMGGNSSSLCCPVTSYLPTWTTREAILLPCVAQLPLFCPPEQHGRQFFFRVLPACLFFACPSNTGGISSSVCCPPAPKTTHRRQAPFRGCLRAPGSPRDGVSGSKNDPSTPSPYLIYLSACARSLIISSTFSIPIEILTNAFVMPRAILVSSGMDSWVCVQG